MARRVLVLVAVLSAMGVEDASACSCADLDPRDRILGYGFGQGAVRRISVCPGSRAAASSTAAGPCGAGRASSG